MRVEALCKRKTSDSVVTEDLLERVKDVVMMLEKDRTGLKQIKIYYTNNCTYVKVIEQ
jgi:hypothetical protein